MIEKMSESEGKILGFKAVGTVTKADYKVLVPEVQTLIEKEGSISMLLDLRQFKWEDIGAWMADMNFGRTYHDKIDKMAIVGDKTWEKWMTTLAEPFYSKKARFFYSEDIDSAWKWLKE
ncbi:MAG: STAS/SEC14 domain-containing protein [Methanobacterium sp.]